MEIFSFTSFPNKIFYFLFSEAILSIKEFIYNLNEKNKYNLCATYIQISNTKMARIHFVKMD